MAETAKSEALELLEAYYRRFGDVYPTLVCPDDSYAEVARKVRECLDRAMPMECDMSDGILY